MRLLIAFIIPLLLSSCEWNRSKNPTGGWRMLPGTASFGWNNPVFFEETHIFLFHESDNELMAIPTTYDRHSFQMAGDVNFTWNYHSDTLVAKLILDTEFDFGDDLEFEFELLPIDLSRETFMDHTGCRLIHADTTEGSSDWWL